MTIYDPPTAEAPKSQWDKYLKGLDPQKDQAEIARVKSFMEKRFSDGFRLVSLILND